MPTFDYLVSCIITTKDRPQLVKKAVESVLGQTHRRLEIILVDDSVSPESCREALGLATGIVYVRHGQDRGACYSRNIGLQEAKGDFIAFLDDDDRWMPDKIEWQLKKAADHPLVSCDYMVSTGKAKRYVQRPEIVSYQDMLYYNHLGSCSFVLGQAAVLKSCRFDENRQAAQDWDMWLTVMQKNGMAKCCIVKKYLVDYNMGPHDRISNTGKLDEALVSLYAKHFEEHTALSTDLFVVYNFLRDGSLFFQVCKIFMKCYLRKKGPLFLAKIIFKRLLGRTEIF